MPEQFFINKRIGQLNEVIDHKGRKQVRQSILFVMLGETIRGLPPVDDQDHILYNNVMPIPQDILVSKYGGVLPPNLKGPNVMCSCGSDAVVLIDGPYAEHVICRAFLMFGKHQTSFKIENNQLILDKKTKDDHYMLDSDMNKLLKDADDK